MEIIETKLDWNYKPGIRNVTTHCILHHAASDGSVQAVHNYHKSKGWAGIAYHYYITKDGKIWRGRQENWIGGHTVGYNNVSIGVCFEGNFEKETMSQAQIKSGQELINDIRKRYPNIIFARHKDLDATACPGKNFPYTQIIKEPEPPEEDNTQYAPWHKEGCEWAIANKIFIGDGTGNYHWKDNITREEIATVMYRLYNLIK